MRQLIVAMPLALHLSVTLAQVTAGSDTHVVQVPYREGAIVSVRGRVGYALDVQLQPGERIANIAAGNLAALDIGVEANHVFLKPRKVGERMNLILLSDRRTYRFDYQVDASRGPDTRDVVYAMVFQYDEPAAPVPATAPARAWNANYWYCGAPQLQPREAFDDGTRTYLRFAPAVELPVAYLVEPDGAERLVNSHVSGDWIVVHQTTRRLALRRGALAGCIENRAMRDGIADREPDRAAVAGNAERGRP